MRRIDRIKKRQGRALYITVAITIASSVMAIGELTTPASAATRLPPFASSTAPVTASTVRYTWRSGCPVGPSALELVHVSYVDFSGHPHMGTIIVNKAIVANVITIFSKLYAARFPIHSMVPEDAFKGSDPLSMAADNSSGFNCRYAVAPGTPTWSVHAYGEAIDINPVQNPYIEGSDVMPTAGRPYVNRADVRPGMAEPNGVLVNAFKSVGWYWGGRWTGSPDYQHFSLNGR